MRRARSRFGAVLPESKAGPRGPPEAASGLRVLECPLPEKGGFSCRLRALGTMGTGEKEGRPGEEACEPHGVSALTPGAGSGRGAYRGGGPHVPRETDSTRVHSPRVRPADAARRRSRGKQCWRTNGSPGAAGRGPGSAPCAEARLGARLGVRLGVRLGAQTSAHAGLLSIYVTACPYLKLEVSGIEANVSIHNELQIITFYK